MKISDNNIIEKWQNIKTIIKETKQLTEKDDSTETLKTRWYDEKCKTAIEVMKKARKKLLMKEGRIKSRRMSKKEKKHIKN